MNKNIICTSLLSVLMLLHLTVVNAQKELTNNCDTVTKSQFWDMVKNFKQRMDKQEFFSTENNIKAIKLYNTLFLYDDTRNKTQNNMIKGYQKVFERIYWRFFAYKFKHLYTKTGIMYLIDFDISIATRDYVVDHVANCRELFTVY